MTGQPQRSPSSSAQRRARSAPSEPSTPTDYLPARVVQFSEYMSWQAVAQWASTLFKTPPPSPRVAALADSLAKGGAKLDRATAALRWVQDEVRYFSVSIGENSHRPQLPDVVLRNRIVKQRSRIEVKLACLKRREADPRPKTRMAQMLFNTRFDGTHGFVKRTRQRGLQLIEA